MTPKEKAEELAGKYWDLNYAWDGVTKDAWSTEGALIAVDEMINECEKYFEAISKDRVEYWKEVKEEIENL
jgi:hypothetical protein